MLETIELYAKKKKKMKVSSGSLKMLSTKCVSKSNI